MQDASVLIIIVTWNKKGYVLSLLSSLQGLRYDRNAIDIVVVDNASNDGTVEALRADYPDVHLLCNDTNLGGTGGFNTGLAWAFEQPAGKYRYLWLLDNDVEVHQRALAELVAILDANEDIAVAGSTMMQLDCPHRINEMGAFFDRCNGTLQFHRHLEEIIPWRGKTLEELRGAEHPPDSLLKECAATLDVDYVAAASLLIRADVARQAGLWEDFFIHFDDVEWCLRIAAMGWRITASARSLIWHLSAAAKVPTWVLYYDNRNIQYVLQKHGYPGLFNRQAMKASLHKALKFTLIGKADLGKLHLRAVDDFTQGIQGGVQLQLRWTYQKNSVIESVFLDPAVKTIVISSFLDGEAAGILPPLAKAKKQRKDLRICFLQTDRKVKWTFPNQENIMIPVNRLSRLLFTLRSFKKFDLVLQSEYQPVPSFSWLAKEILFVNDFEHSRRPVPRLSQCLGVAWSVFKKRIFG